MLQFSEPYVAISGSFSLTTSFVVCVYIIYTLFDFSFYSISITHRLLVDLGNGENIISNMT
jgi:hypothetical protein